MIVPAALQQVYAIREPFAMLKLSRVAAKKF